MRRPATGSGQRKKSANKNASGNRTNSGRGRRRTPYKGRSPRKTETPATPSSVKSPPDRDGNLLEIPSGNNHSQEHESSNPQIIERDNTVGISQKVEEKTNTSGNIKQPEISIERLDP